jgi:uncharacterized protein YndB with AHSA1/START domain
MAQQEATAVQATITVDAPLERAFTVFTDDIGSWFPREYNLMQSDIVERVFEPHVGGHIFDKGAGGEECHWGRVLAYEPPTRVVFSWDITPQWTIAADPSETSEVEVVFVAESDGRTRVELEHRHLERHGDGWEQLRDSIAGDGGWSGCLAAYAAHIVA